jgi:hypothetical protein
MNKYIKPNKTEPKKTFRDYFWEWLPGVGWLFVLGMIYSMACKGKARAEDSVHNVNPLLIDSISQPTTKFPTPADVLRGSVR